jgi:hypothetical protein
MKNNIRRQWTNLIPVDKYSKREIGLIKGNKQEKIYDIAALL